MPQELTLAVMGADFPNADGSNRRFEIMMAQPGDAIELRPEPKNRHDANAVAIFGLNHVQIGYVSAERAPLIRARLNRGDAVVAIFQGVAGGTAFVRVRFGGGAPTLPPHTSGSPPHDDSDAFHADEDPSEWGA